MSGNDHAIRSDALARSYQELVSDMQLRDVDHGLTGTNRDRPGLRRARAACRAVTPWQ